MKYSDALNAVVWTGSAPFETATDLFVLELEERLELSSVAADLLKCLADAPGSSI